MEWYTHTERLRCGGIRILGTMGEDSAWIVTEHDGEDSAWSASEESADCDRGQSTVRRV